MKETKEHSPLGICKFRNYDYKIIEARMEIDIRDEEIWLCPSFTAEYENENDELDFEICSIYAYFNGDFNTKKKNLQDLVGCKFQCDSDMPDDGDIALFYVVEHEDIHNGVLEILEVTDTIVKFNWQGEANVYWDDDFSTDVPFNVTANGKIME